MLDTAAETYLRLVGGSPVCPSERDGALTELLQKTDERGPLSGDETAEILVDHELPVQYEPVTWSVDTDQAD